MGVEPAISAQGHTKSINLYEIRAISLAVTTKDIKRPYRKLAREFHPDHAASLEKNKSTHMILRIQNAYVTLSDLDDRTQYDRQLLAPMRGSIGQCGVKRPMGDRPYIHILVMWGRNWESDQCW